MYTRYYVFQIIIFLLDRNASTNTIQNLQYVSRDPAFKLAELTEVLTDASSSTSLSLLVKFQRLLVSKLYVLENSSDATITSEPG